MTNTSTVHGPCCTVYAIPFIRGEAESADEVTAQIEEWMGHPERGEVEVLYFDREAGIDWLRDKAHKHAGCSNFAHVADYVADHPEVAGVSVGLRRTPLSCDG